MTVKRAYHSQGDCFAARAEPREGANLLVTIIVEDDGNWLDKMSFDVAWLPEVIDVLQDLYKLIPQKDRR